jgi:long-subunit acyl-CoA synthetase (AMP-forming)
MALRPGTPAGQAVAIMAPNGPEWMIALLACIAARRPVFAVAATLPVQQVAAVLAQGDGAAVLITTAQIARQLCAAHVVVGLPNIQCIVCIDGDSSGSGSIINGIQQPAQVDTRPALGITCRSFAAVEGATSAETKRPQLERQQSTAQTRSAVAMVLFTSGSCGSPKGVPRTVDQLKGIWRHGNTPQSCVHLSVQPLSHTNEATLLPVILLRGGQIAFTSDAGIVGTNANLFDDYRSLRPTFVFSVPRLFEAIQGMFDGELARAVAAGESEAGAEARLIEAFRGTGGPLGGRVGMLAVGSAPVSAD